MTKVLVFILGLKALLCSGQAEVAVLTIEPNWLTFHPGESVTFTCDMNEGKDTDWEYEIRRNGEQFIHSYLLKSYMLQPIQTDHSGEYQCCGVRKSSTDTKCSGTVSLTVTAQPIARLTPGPTTIPAGGSVTLRCSVEPPAGWKYRWFRLTINTPADQLTDKESREITVTQGGTYQCMGVRGNTNFYSVISDEVIITKTLSNKVVVTRRPNWPQMFSGETITLTCEVQGGETTEWMCEWRRSGSIIQSGNDKELTVSVSESSSGVYRCRCRRRDDWFSVTKWSEKIPVSVSVTSVQHRAKLTAGPTTIPAGGSVTLRCSVEPPAGWKYRWFRKTKISPENQLTDEENREINVRQGGIYQCMGVRGNTNFHSLISDEVNITITFSNEVVVTRHPKSSQMFSGETITLTCEVQGGETIEWTYEWRRDGTTVVRRNDKDLNVTISESSSGDYMCQCRLRDDWSSVTRWSETIPVSGTVSSSGISSSPLLLIIGLISGVLLVIFLLLLWCYRRSNDLFCFRLSSSQSSAVSHGADQTEGHVYSSLLHRTTSVYETVRPLGATGNERHHHHPEEDSVYVNMRPGHKSSA